jgi:hypothetical protein
MTKLFCCDICNYQTIVKCNYIKHLTTTKHQKNIQTNHFESLTNHFESPTNHFESPTNQPTIQKTFKCSYCNYSSKYKQNYNRHIVSCKFKNNSISNIDESIIAEKDFQISTLTQTINELKTKNKIDILSTENKLLKQHNNQISNIQNTQNIQNNGSIGDNNINNITNITQYIKNTFPNAPNVKPIENIDNVDKYLGNNYNDSYTLLIHDHYLKNIDPEDRSLWLVDSSRDKYLTRLNDNWQVDLHGEEFCKIVNKALSKAIFDKNNEIKDYKEHMSFVLLELLLYVGGQSRLPKSNKSKFLLQNIKNWKNLGKN